MVLQWPLRNHHAGVRTDVAVLLRLVESPSRGRVKEQRVIIDEIAARKRSGILVPDGAAPIIARIGTPP
jgi:hypothetical protein